MHSRLKGLSRARVAVMCAAEVDVSVPLVLNILKGQPVRSSQGRRVLRWCQEYGYPLTKEPTTSNALDALARAEADAAERKARS